MFIGTLLKYIWPPTLRESLAPCFSARGEKPPAIATAAAPMSAPAKHTDPMPKAVLTAPPTAEPPPIPKLNMPE